MATTTSQPFQEGKQHLHLHHGGRALPSVYGGTALRPASSAPPPLPRLEMPSSSRRSAQQALKIHSEAERRRRERINAHLATLRRMIPDARQVRLQFEFGVLKRTAELHFCFFNYEISSCKHRRRHQCCTTNKMINSNVTVCS